MEKTDIVNTAVIVELKNGKYYQVDCDKKLSDLILEMIILYSRNSISLSRYPLQNIKFDTTDDLMSLNNSEEFKKMEA